MIKKIIKFKWLLIPFSISVFIGILVFAKVGVFPFGNKVSFYWDGYGQCYPFLQSLRNSLLTGKDLGFSMQSAMGMDNTGLISYYLSSPINLVVLLFPAKWGTEAYFTIMLLKLGLGAMSFALFAYVQLKCSKFTSFLFAIPYGLMAWVVSYSFFYMWLDGIIWLPLICLGINRLINKNKSMMLIICYTFMFLSNYYIGFMVGLFSAIYFVYCMVQDIEWSTVKTWIWKGLRLIISGIIAFCMVAWIILPTYLLMRENMDVMGAELPLLEFNFTSFVDIFRSFLIRGVTSDIAGIKLFVGILAFVLAITFFFNKNFSLRKRLASVGLLLGMIFSMQINLFNLAWHLMDDPTGFPYRQSFIVSFIVLCFAAVHFEEIRKGSKLTEQLYYRSSIILFVVLLMYNGIFSEQLKIKVLYVNILIVVLWCLFIFVYSKYKDTKLKVVASAFLVILMCLDVGCQSTGMILEESLMPRDDLVQKMINIEKIQQDFKQKDSGFYRFGDSKALTANDGMTYDYMSIAHHSSAENLALIHFLQNLGYPQRDWEYRNYYTQDIITDALFGIKYMTPADEKNSLYPITTIAQDSENAKDLNYQENPYALPLIFCSNGTFEVDTKGNMLEVQQSLFNSITSDVTCVQLLERNNAESDVYVYTCTVDGPVYFNFSNVQCPFTYQIGEEAPITDSFETETTPYLLGDAKQGDTILLHFNPEDKKTEIDEKSVYVMQINQNEFTKLCNKIQSKTTEIKRTSNNVFEATVVSEEGDSLCITIPSSNGWELTIDGKAVEIESSLSYFMGAKLTAGTHQIVLKYTTPGLLVGSAVSITTLVALISVYVFKSIKKRGSAQ